MGEYESASLLLVCAGAQGAHFDFNEADSFRSINPLQIVGAVIAVSSFVPLMWGISYSWVLTLVMAAVGVTLLAYGYTVAFRFNPNSGDPELRKAIGRTRAVWGDQLAEMLATNPTGELADVPAPPTGPR